MVSIFSEQDFMENMRRKVAPWRKEHLHSGHLTSYDGTKLQYYYAIHPRAKGSIVVLHGFTEFIGKYREMLWYYYQEGYNVFFHEQRGHGRSGRTNDDPCFVHVDRFSQYVLDLKYLLDHRYLPLIEDTRPHPAADRREGASPLILFAHSMGGAVGALFLERYPGYFDKAILSSPMMRINLDSIPKKQQLLLKAMAKAPGISKKPVPGQPGFDPDERFENSHAGSRARFDYVLELRRHYPEYQTGGFTFGWIMAALRSSRLLLLQASRVQIPVLLLQAGADRLVKPQAHELFARRSGHTDLYTFADAPHELYLGDDQVLPAYYRTIFSFLSQ